MTFAVPTRSGRSLIAITLVAFAAACNEPQRTTAPSEQNVPINGPLFTAGVGFSGSLLARASSADGFKLTRKNGKWEFDLNAKDPTDVATQSLNFEPGGSSGWHSHPGPVLVQVTAGTLTFYEAGHSACSPHTRTAGQLFIEDGAHPHIARNESGSVATAIATVFAPTGTALRIEEAAPGNCPF